MALSLVILSNILKRSNSKQCKQMFTFNNGLKPRQEGVSKRNFTNGIQNRLNLLIIQMTLIRCHMKK